MASELVLALDQGSSSSRALAFDARGRVAARAQFPVRTFFPRPGWVEHDAEDLFRTQARALDRVLAAIPARARVLGLGLAAQRSTIVLWDSRTGKPVCRAPSWQDARAAAAVAGLASRRDEVHEKTGLYPTPFYSAPKIRFLLDSNAAARRLLEAGRLRIGPVSTYILWRLSEGRIFACDPTMAQRTLLFDIRRGDWDPSLLGFFAIPRAALPALAPTMGPLGSIERSGRKVPVLAAVGDQQAAAAALGSRPGLGVLNLGTGAFFLLNTGTDLRRVPGLLSSVAWRKAGEPCRYLLEGTVHAVGTSLEWLRQLGLLADPRRADAACRRSKQRLWALSAIGGLGAPRWDYSTPSAFWGLDARTRPEDLARATVESVAFLVSDIVDAMRAAGNRVSAVRASGGLSRLRHLMRFSAGLLGVPVRTVAEHEATAAGAALLAARQAGAPWAERLVAGGGAPVSPSVAPDEAARLLPAWRAFVSAQQALAAELSSKLRS